MNYWVNSPHIEQKNLNEWIEYCRRNNVAIMGWTYEDPLGKMFKDRIEIGDLILVAQGSNRKKRLCLVGYVASNAETKTIIDPPFKGLSYLRHLNPAKILKDNPADYGMSFYNAAWGNSDMSPALYRLYPDDNDADKEIVDILRELLSV